MLLRAAHATGRSARAPGAAPRRRVRGPAWRAGWRAGRRAGALAAMAGLLAGAAHAGALRVTGSTTVAPVVERAAERLRARSGLEIQVDTQGGSSGGIAALGDGRADVAMSSRPLDERDARLYPDTRFRPVPIGYDAVALVVSRDVWEAGLHALDREQVQGIYEGRLRRWEELGGPARPIVFFDKEPGRGTWEVFANWLYGDASQAPLVSHRHVGSNREARTKVASTPGAITQLSAAWADGRKTFALALRNGRGEAVPPSPEAVAAGRYPMARPLLLLTDGPPDAQARALLDFLRGSEGQALVREVGYLGLDAVAESQAQAPGP